MTKQRESKLSQKIIRELRKHKVFCFKVHGSAHMPAGLPDIICCVDGLFVGLEVKHPETENNLSPRQRLIQNDIRKAKGTAEVVTDVEEALAVIEHTRRWYQKSDSGRP